MHTPLLTSLDCEGGGEVFQVMPQPQDMGNIEKENFFRGPSYLTVSAQLHLEMAATALSRAYTISPCFRADIGSEESVRHLAEFHMVEAEWAWPSLYPPQSLSQIHRNQAALLENDHTNTHIAFKQDQASSNVNGSISCNQVHHSQALDDSQDLVGLLNVIQSMIKHTVQRILDRHDQDIEFIANELKHLQPKSSPLTPKDIHNTYLSNPFNCITYSEAIEILQSSQKKKKKIFKTAVKEWGQPLQAEHERYLCQEVFHGRPLFVIQYPQSCKPFYMRTTKHRSDGKGGLRGETVECVDLLVPRIGELVGGSVREDRYTVLRANLEQMYFRDRHVSLESNAMADEHGLKEWMKSYEWYLDLRRYGSVPHAGFGLGLERLLMALTGMENIRDVVLLPRFRSQCRF
jgi:asparaginyl-tRNA synthetase